MTVAFAIAFALLGIALVATAITFCRDQDGWPVIVLPAIPGLALIYAAADYTVRSLA